MNLEEYLNRLPKASKVLRRALNLTAKELAKCFNVCPQDWYAYERGERKISVYRYVSVRTVLEYLVMEKKDERLEGIYWRMFDEGKPVDWIHKIIHREGQNGK